MLEFVEQESIVPALKLNNKQFGDNIIKYVLDLIFIICFHAWTFLFYCRVYHSTQAIIKPVQQTKSNEAAQKEIEEAVNRVKEAQQSMVAVPLTPEEPGKFIHRQKVVVHYQFYLIYLLIF